MQVPQTCHRGYQWKFLQQVWEHEGLHNIFVGASECMVLTVNPEGEKVLGEELSRWHHKCLLIKQTLTDNMASSLQKGNIPDAQWCSKH